MQTNFIALYLLFKWISIVCLLISYTPPRLAPIPLTLSPSWPRFAGQLNCSALIRTWTLSETGITDMKTDTCLSHKLFCSTWRLIYNIVRCQGDDLSKGDARRPGFKFTFQSKRLNCIRHISKAFSRRSWPS